MDRRESLEADRRESLEAGLDVLFVLCGRNLRSFRRKCSTLSRRRRVPDPVVGDSFRCGEDDLSRDSVDVVLCACFRDGLRRFRMPAGSVA